MLFTGVVASGESLERQIPEDGIWDPESIHGRFVYRSCDDPFLMTL